MAAASGDAIPPGGTGDEAGAPLLTYSNTSLGARAPTPPAITILLIGLALFYLVLKIAGPVVTLLPWAWDARATIDLPTSRPGKFLPTASFQISAQGIGRGSATRLDYGSVVFNGMDTPGALYFDLRKMTCGYGLDTGERIGPMPLDRQAVLAYVSRAGYAPGSPEAGKVADVLLSEILKLKNGPLPPQRQGPPYVPQAAVLESRPRGDQVRTKFDSPAILPWYTPWIVPIWLAAWLGISWPVMRSYRRRLADFRAGAP